MKVEGGGIFILELEVISFHPPPTNWMNIHPQLVRGFLIGLRAVPLATENSPISGKLAVHSAVNCDTFWQKNSCSHPVQQIYSFQIAYGEGLRL